MISFFPSSSDPYHALYRAQNQDGAQATDTDGTNLQLLLRVKEMMMQNPTLPSGSI